MINNEEEDKAILLSIVEEMTKSTSGLESTKNWAADALWFDIPPFASRGIKPAIKKLDITFESLKSCNMTIIHKDIFIGKDLGIVCTIQHAKIELLNGVSKTFFFRETDCFKKDANNHWLLVHQHTSIPSGGNWNGDIITE